MEATIHSILNSPDSQAYIELHKLVNDSELNTLALTAKEILASPFAEPFLRLYAEEQAQLNTPKQPDNLFFFDETPYYHIADTGACSPDVDFIKGTSLSYTWLKLLQFLRPGVAKSLRRNIEPPDSIYKLGPASRRRIVRALQLHLQLPPQLPLDLQQFSPYFDYLANRVQDNRGFTQEYRSCQWALTNYLDVDLTTSFLIHYGNAPIWKEIHQAGTSFHRLDKQADGVLVTIDYPHTLQDRVNYCCAMAYEEYRRDIAAERQSAAANYERTAYLNLYCYNGWFFSPTRGLYNALAPRIQEFIHEMMVNALNDIIIYPQIDEPDDFLLPETFLIKFADFTIGKKSAVQAAHLNSLAQQKCIRANRHKFLKLSSAEVYRTPDLNAIGLEKEGLTNALNHNLVTRIAHGKYIVNYDIISENEDVTTLADAQHHIRLQILAEQYNIIFDDIEQLYYTVNPESTHIEEAYAELEQQLIERSKSNVIQIP
jgi:hypothetical protein